MQAIIIGQPHEADLHSSTVHITANHFPENDDPHPTLINAGGGGGGDWGEYWDYGDWSWGGGGGWDAPIDTGSTVDMSTAVAGEITIEGDGVTTGIISYEQGGMHITMYDATDTATGNSTIMFTSEAYVNGQLTQGPTIVVTATETGVDYYRTEVDGTSSKFRHDDFPR